MPDAIVTDINEYRAKKAGLGPMTHIDPRYFVDWSDDRIRTRYTLLKHIAAGLTDIHTTDHPLVRSAFPEGYNPELHPEDNMKLVYEEGVRRGVFPSLV
jgi:hypothetical protein